MLVTFAIDGKAVMAPAGVSVMVAAADAGIYIPALCFHPDLSQACRAGADEGDNHLCLVEVAGAAGLQKACSLEVAARMRVITDSPALRQVRQDSLARLLATHPHVCLTCPERDGCSRTSCSFSNPVEARCCSIFNHCELRKVADYVVIPAQTPAYRSSRLPVVRDEPFYDRDYNLCIDCRRCLVACNEVRGVGCLEIKNTEGRTWVGTIAPTLIESGCKFCNACVEVCPTGALLDRTLTAKPREEALVPCTAACPAGIDVPRYVQLVGLGKYSEATAVVREKLPFPGILGRACFSPCESACRRQYLDDPLSIRSLKRIAADNDSGLWRENSRQLPPSGRKAAVIGAGPAGLAVAYYLAKKGHAVTVFEALPAAGGMARYGIPAFRLPREVIDAEIAEVEKLGVEFRFNARIDSIDGLLQEGYEAVFVGIGAQGGDRLGIPGDDLPGVVDSARFLREVALGQRNTLPGRRVAVIGGGNVACDDSRTARRLGGEEVALMYRRSEAEMPARAGEIEACREEGITLRFLTLPKSIEADGKSAALKITCVQTSLEAADSGGRRRPVEIPGSEFVETVDLVISAVGQHVEGADRFNIRTDSTGRIQVRDDSLLASRPGVFAGGDAVLGPATLIDAVAQGRKAAAAMDAFLGGDGDIEEKLLADDWQTDPHIGREEGFNRRRRFYPLSSESSMRQDWCEVEQAFPLAMAQAEAQRCLKCNLSARIGDAVLPPVAWRILNEAAVLEVVEASGVYRLFDANRKLLAIRGVESLRQGLAEVLGKVDFPLFFDIEVAHLFSQRESQLIQGYLEQFGAMPPGVGDDAMDDLY